MRLIRGISEFFKKLDDNHIGEYAAECSYYTFLSFIPFIILLLSLVKYINIEKESLIYIFESFFPSIMQNSIYDIIQEVYSKSIETLSISIIFILWSASKSFYVLNKGLSAIYKNDIKQNYFFQRIKGMIGAIVALFLIVFVLLLLVFGNIIEAEINEHFKSFSNVFNFIINIRWIISIVSMFFIFLIMYKVTSNRRGVKLKKYMIGAAFASIAWYAISYFFSIYVNIFTSFSVIYGSLATIIIIMMWLYAVIYSIFLGAEINEVM